MALLPPGKRTDRSDDDEKYGKKKLRMPHPLDKYKASIDQLCNIGKTVPAELIDIQSKFHRGLGEGF
ncbi:hypothetical protein G6L28_22185 [Agrobacterium larrymoorei]|uniref:hypothetical protein n=1 Tax=Agrobacterium larrymoorei TaxID=160699 RepID=UPI0015739692|nr:hypothetical protein [Agrobacterium larrymoorei]NTJ45282.1 hypothetical protein [Agrobacterium larrymoorei]